MRTLVKIVVIALLTISLAKADILKPGLNVYFNTSIEIIRDFGNNNYILCIEGYKWLKFNGYVPQQIFKESTKGVSIPMDCSY